MALIIRGLYKLILRPYVEQDVKADAWKYLLENCEGLQNWDREIFLFSAMNSMDMEMISRELMGFGYRWTQDLNNSDFAWFLGELPKLDWLEQIIAKPIRPKLEEVALWQMRGSRIQRFSGHNGKTYFRDIDYKW